MMFPKTNPRDPEIIKQLKREQTRCEKCGSQNQLEAAHIISKGAGGPDMRENVLILCGPASMQQGCHGANHLGILTQAELFKITARREGIDPEECRRRVRRRMGYDI